jgi:uncharacterized C2H2 Zn-finger protein
MPTDMDELERTVYKEILEEERRKVDYWKGFNEECEYRPDIAHNGCSDEKMKGFEEKIKCYEEKLKIAEEKMKLKEEVSEVKVVEIENVGLACDQCGARFRRSNHLRRHKETYHEENKIDCEHCDKTFKRRDQLKRHIEKDHSNKEMKEERREAEIVQ